jgi:hypothetical protein
MGSKNQDFVGAGMTLFKQCGDEKVRSQVHPSPLLATGHTSHRGGTTAEQGLGWGAQAHR